MTKSVKRRWNNELLNVDLFRLSKQGRANRVDFSAHKPQCPLLTNELSTGIAVTFVVMGGANNKKTEALNVSSMRIQSDSYWNEHIFKVSWFFEKLHTPFDISGSTKNLTSKSRVSYSSSTFEYHRSL